MKRILLLAMSAIICSELCSALSVTYLTTYHLTIGGPRFTCENTLDASSSGSIFYSGKQLRQAFVNDSLLACGASPYDAIDIWKREGLSGHTSFAVFKNYPTDDSITVTDEMMYFYSYTESMPEFRWNYLDADSVILGYPVHKAETVYRGRKWTVYYAPDIPISDGPWKLCGLPGLILSAADSTGEFSFATKKVSLTGKENPDARRLLKRARHSSALEMSRLRRLMFWDECQFDKEVLKKASQLFDAQGHQLPPSHRKACLIEFPPTK